MAAPLTDVQVGRTGWQVLLKISPTLFLSRLISAPDALWLRPCHTLKQKSTLIQH